METRIATSIEQSKKLIELGVDVNTADMDYIPFANDPKNYDCVINLWNNEHEDDWIPAWSEEDERLRKTSISFLKHYADKGYENAVECIDWLESIRPQKQWKPSEEQMIALRQAISGCSYDIEPLVELETKLKEL